MIVIQFYNTPKTLVCLFPYTYILTLGRFAYNLHKHISLRGTIEVFRTKIKTIDQCLYCCNTSVIWSTSLNAVDNCCQDLVSLVFIKIISFELFAHETACFESCLF